MIRLRDVTPTTLLTDAEASELGIYREDLLVVRFLDTSEHKRWFQRDVEELGRVSAGMVDGAPLFRDDVLRFAREHFGADVAVLW